MKTLFILLLFLSSPIMAQTVLRYEGYIENTGVPVNASAQSFSVSIMMSGCATALTSTTTGADIVNGEFNIAPSFADSALFSQIMNPSYTNGSCPVANSNRVMRIVWSGQTFDINMNDAARSSFSNATASLNGRSQDEFLKIVSYPGQAPLSNAQVSTLVDLISGTSVQYLQPSSNFIGDVTGTSTASVVSRIRGTSVSATAPTVNQILKFDGTNWTPSADDSGVSTDASYAAKGIVQVSTDATVSGLSIAAGILSMPNIGTPATYGSATMVPVITMDTKGRVTNVVDTPVNDATKLALAGGTMTGAINMGAQNITNATSVAATNFSGRNFIINDNDTNTATLRVPTDITANYTLILPANDGDSGQILTTDGAGVLSWVAAGGSGTVTNVASANAYLTIANGATTPLITANVGTAVNTLASGDDSRIVNAVQQAAYAADLAPAAVCSNIQTPYWNTVSDTWACQNIMFIGGDINNEGNSIANNITIGTNDNFALSFETNNLPRLTILNDGRIGIGTMTPSSTLDLSGAFTIRGITNPGISIATQGRIYFDSTLNRYRISENGQPYQDLNSVRFPEDATAGASIAIGENALATQLTASNFSNIAIGRNVLDSVTTGNLNVGVGAPGVSGNPPLTDLTSGFRNTAVGAGAGSNITSGSNNTVFGAEAFTTSTTGSSNTYIGFNSGNNASSNSNTAVGSNTLTATSGTGNNNAFGNFSLQQVTTGAQNVGIGSYAGGTLISGSFNTLVGGNAGYGITSGNRNVILGYEVGSSSLTTGSHNILIGTSLNVSTPIPTTNYYLNIGNVIQGTTQSGIEQLKIVTNSTDRLIVDTAGNVGIGTNTPIARLDVNGPVRLGTDSSTLSKVVFCNPTVAIGSNLVTPGDSINLQVAGSSCPGIVSGMVVSCSWVSETNPLGRLTWTTIQTNATDQANGAIRIRFTNQAMTGNLPVAATTLGLACFASIP